MIKNVEPVGKYRIKFSAEDSDLFRDYFSDDFFLGNKKEDVYIFQYEKYQFKLKNDNCKKTEESYCIGIKNNQITWIESKALANYIDNATSYVIEAFFEDKHHSHLEKMTRNSKKSLKKNLEIKDPQFFFFDDSWFGTHSNVGYGWFKRGERSSVNLKLGFENFYIYSAMNPFEGSNFTLKMPSVNTDCMNVFLAEMSKMLGENSVQIVMNGAGWHK